MGSRAALAPTPASASRRPRCFPSGRRVPPARASIRVLARGYQRRRAAAGVRAGPSLRWALVGGSLLCDSEVSKVEGKRTRARRHFSSFRRPPYTGAVREGERCGPAGRGLGARAGGLQGGPCVAAARGGGWAPRGAAGPNPLPFPPSASRAAGEGSFFTFFTPPLPPLQSNLGEGSPASRCCSLADATSRCGVTGCSLRQVPLTSLPLSSLWAWETLALGAGLREGR